MFNGGAQESLTVRDENDITKGFPGVEGTSEKRIQLLNRLSQTNNLEEKKNPCTKILNVEKCRDYFK